MRTTPPGSYPPKNRLLCAGTAVPLLEPGRRATTRRSESKSGSGRCSQWDEIRWVPYLDIGWVPFRQNQGSNQTKSCKMSQETIVEPLLRGVGSPTVSTVKKSASASATPRRASKVGKKPDAAEVKRGISFPDRVVETILEGVRLGRYVPGQKLIEADLTRSLGVSRGPIREALTRLAAEGIITLTRHRGAYIRALTREETYETLGVLDVLTGLMARLAAEAVKHFKSPEQVREISKSLVVYTAGELDGLEQIERRRHFYDTLAEIGGNLTLGQVMPTMQIHLLRLQMQPYQTAQGRRVQLAGYAEVARAVLAGNALAADNAMRKHIRRTRARYERIPDAAYSTAKNSVID